MDFTKLVELVTQYGVSLIIATIVIYFLFRFGQIALEWTRKRLLSDPEDTHPRMGFWCIPTEIMNEAPIGLVEIDDHGVMTQVNDWVCDVSEYPRDRLIGQSVEILMEPKYRSAHSGFVARYLKNPSVRRMGNRSDLALNIYSKSGVLVPVSIGIAGYNEDGKIKGLAIIQRV